MRNTTHRMWADGFPEPIKSRFYNELEKRANGHYLRQLDNVSHSPQNTITCLLEWRFTEQGHDYWNDIFDRVDSFYSRNYDTFKEQVFMGKLEFKDNVERYKKVRIETGEIAEEYEFDW